MAARLYFAIAMAVPHQIYLIDEILSVGDEHFQAKCWRLLRKRLGNGASGVLVTHDWSAIVKLCRESHILEQGRFTFSGASHEAVAKYLEFPVVRHPDVHFSDLPGLFSAASGNDWAIEIGVATNAAIECEFACSIEALRLGTGWEILLLSDFKPIPSVCGHQVIRIEIPQLPLAEGNYNFNLFLRSRSHPDRPSQILDQRSWTSGNPIALRVAGESSAILPRLALRWNLEGLVHPHA